MQPLVAFRRLGCNNIWNDSLASTFPRITRCCDCKGPRGASTLLNFLGLAGAGIRGELNINVAVDMYLMVMILWHELSVMPEKLSPRNRWTEYESINCGLVIVTVYEFTLCHCFSVAMDSVRNERLSPNEALLILQFVQCLRSECQFAGPQSSVHGERRHQLLANDCAMLCTVSSE